LSRVTVSAAGVALSQYLDGVAAGIATEHSGHAFMVLLDIGAR